MPQLGEEVRRKHAPLTYHTGGDTLGTGLPKPHPSHPSPRPRPRPVFRSTGCATPWWTMWSASRTTRSARPSEIASKTRARCSSPQAPPRWRYIGLQAATHTVAGATSIAGLKKWAAQQQPSADGAALRQYVAVASDACNIEFDFLGKPHGQARRRGSGRSGHLRLEAPSRWHMPSGSVWAPKQSCYGRVGPRIRALQPCPAASPGRRPKR